MHGTLFLNPVSYMPVVLLSLISMQGTDEARMNYKIKQILTKYETCIFILRASSGMCFLFQRNVFLSESKRSKETNPSHSYVFTCISFKDGLNPFL